MCVCVCVCVAKHHPVKAYGGVDIYYHVVLTSTLDGNECSYFLIDHRPLYPRGIFLVYDCKGGCVGPKAGLDVLEKIYFASVGSRSQDCQACSFVTVLTNKSDRNMAMNASD